MPGICATWCDTAQYLDEHTSPLVSFLVRARMDGDSLIEPRGELNFLPPDCFEQPLRPCGQASCSSLNDSTKKTEPGSLQGLLWRQLIASGEQPTDLLMSVLARSQLTQRKSENHCGEPKIAFQDLQTPQAPVRLASLFRATCSLSRLFVDLEEPFPNLHYSRVIKRPQ